MINKSNPFDHVAVSRRRVMQLCLSAAAAVALRSSLVQAVVDPTLEPEKPSTNPVRKPTDSPSLQPVADDPALPRVLLIGDSISLGYTVATRKKLAGKANLHRPLTNCGPTSKALIELAGWLTTDNTGGPPAKKWDVIHFNFGLHDLKFVDAKGRTVSPSEGKQNVPPTDYEKNLHTIIDKLKATGATLIWATTTPVPDGLPGHLPVEVTKYNQIAAAVMKKEGIAIDDLFALVQPREAELQIAANVHFHAAGYDLMAEQVASSIEKALSLKK